MPATMVSTSMRELKTVKPRCEDCFFGRRGLCALNLGEPCSTFRAEGPNGIVPPSQPALIFIDSPAEHAA